MPNKPYEKQVIFHINLNFVTLFLLLTCTLFSLVFIYFSSPNFLYNVSSCVPFPCNNMKQKPKTSDECEGKYIFIQDVPPQFNHDLLENCSTLNKWMNMCDYLVNSGLGPGLNNSNQPGCFGSSWFATNQFALEVIFHARMKQYKCLTNDSSKASAIFVPYYAGLDAGRYLWNTETSLRDSSAVQLVTHLRNKLEWSKMNGRDHFLVAGRVSWDFRRQSNRSSDWGNCLFALPEVKNMTSLVIESSPWSNSDVAIPYPTNFHPSSDAEIHRWQGKMRNQTRPYLFSFAGAPRPQYQDSIRNEIINQCISSNTNNCKFLKCDPNTKNCDQPGELMSLFQSSVFCLQPPGDSFTRKSSFDSIISGCIPVFFHPASAYVQYVWHLPDDFTRYSIFIPIEEVKDGNTSIERRLLEISNEKVMALREEVIGLIPKISYANPSSRLETFEDAFDVSIANVLKRVEMIKNDMNGEKKLSSSFERYPEEYSWKYNIDGGLDNHEWDHYFRRT